MPSFGLKRHKIKGPKYPPPTPERIAPRPPAPGGLRIAFLVYRGNPRCGGQGVYTRHLTRELVELGHSVEVFAGQPWPEVDEGVGFTPVPSLDLYRDPDPFRIPRPREFRNSYPTSVAALEFGVMCTAGFPEPWTFSIRARRMLAARRDEFDLVHDNQCLGNGILGMMDDGWPLLTTLHHPITVDRQLALSHATNPWQQFTQRRWFGFLRMQVKVARALPRVVTVSESSKADIAAQMGVDLDRMTVVPVGVDHTVFRPRDDVEPGPRSDHGHLVVRRPHEGSGAAARGGGQAAHRAGRSSWWSSATPAPTAGWPRPSSASTWPPSCAASRGISDDELARNYAQAEVAVVPSLYEGFSLPAIEAMACGVPSGGHHRRGPARGGGDRRGHRAAGAAGRSRGPGRGHRPAARRRRAAPARSGRPDASGCSAGSPGRSPRRAPPPSTGPCSTMLSRRVRTVRADMTEPMETAPC